MQITDGDGFQQYIARYSLAQWPPSAIPGDPGLEKASEKELLKLFKLGTQTQKKNALSVLLDF